MKHYFLFILTAFIINTGFAQHGPGGVGSNDGTSNLEFWYMAQGENYLDGDLVDTISDLSGNGRHAIAAGSERPSFVSSTMQINANSSLFFDGNDELESEYMGNSNENMTVGIIMSSTPTSYLDVAIQHGGRNLVGINANNYYYDNIGGTTHTSNTASNSIVDATWTYHGKTIATSGGDRLKFYVNQAVQHNFTHNIENLSDKTWIGGKGNGPGTNFDGNIAEVYKFSKVLNLAEHIIVANYMSAKYNIPLAQSDIYNEDDAANGDFDNNVAGIGRLDLFNQHVDAQGTGIIRVLNPSNLDNNEFLMWGHDYGDLQARDTLDVPTTVTSRLERVWRASEVDTTGNAVDVGSVDVQIDLSSYGFIYTADLRLIVDQNNDGIFSDEIPIAGATALGGNIYEFTGVSTIANNLRFTIGISVEHNPPQVETYEIDNDSTITDCLVFFDLLTGLNTIDYNGGTYGIFDLDSIGCFTYIADTAFHGQDLVTIVGCDSTGICDTITLNILVSGYFNSQIVELYGADHELLNNCLTPDELTGSFANQMLIYDYVNGDAVIYNDTCISYWSNVGFDGIDTLVVVSCDDYIPPKCDTIIYYIHSTAVVDTTIIDPTAINEIENTQFTILNVYPNPFDTELVIQYYQYSKESIHIKLFNITGKLISNNVILDSTLGLNQTNLKTGDLSRGTYFIEINNGNFSYRKKLIK